MPCLYLWISFCLGFSSILVQMLLIHEFLGSFSGNELIIGVFFSNWLLCGGLGSFISRFLCSAKTLRYWLVPLQLLAAILPLASLLGLAAFRLQYAAGLMLSLEAAFLISLVLVLPYCVVAAMLLPLYVEDSKRKGDAEPLRGIYSADMLGGIAGGLLFSFVLALSVDSLSTVYGLLCLGIINTLPFLWKAMPSAESRSFSIVAVITALAAALSAPAFNGYVRHSVLFGQDYIKIRSTPYNRLVMQKQGTQYSIFANGQPLLSNQDPLTAEEQVHYAMPQHARPERVLLIGSPLLGGLGELLKYPLIRIDYVDLDPAIVGLARDLFPELRDPRVQSIATDARRFIEDTKGAYDIILMSLPDPSSGQMNRFYTIEYFQALESAMGKNGIVGFSISGAENYAGPELQRLTASINAALCDTFSHVLLFPGATQYFIASDAPLSYDVYALLQGKGIAARYLTKAFLEAKLGDGRLEGAQRMLTLPVKPNSDLSPIAYYESLLFWLKHFEGGQGIVLGILLLLFFAACALVALSRSRLVASAIAGSGFTGIGLEIVIILAFQVVSGAVFQNIGVLVSAFLAGGALGAIGKGRLRIDPVRWVVRTDLGLAVFSLALACFFGLFMSRMDVSLNVSILLFSILNLFCGFLVGLQFVCAAQAEGSFAEDSLGARAGFLFALDFVGAALGSFVVSIFGIPLLGLLGVCLGLCVVKLLSAVPLLFRAHSEDVSAGKTRKGPVLVMLLLFGVIGALILNEKTKVNIFAISFLRPYHWILFLFSTWEFCRALNWPRTLIVKVDTYLNEGPLARMLPLGGMSLGRWLNYIVFSLVIFYPIFRCFFKIPYLFCHVCPRKCVFGYLRPYLVPAALIMNLEKRHWCYNACPIGALHDCQGRAVKKLRPSPRFFGFLGAISLIVTAVYYFKVAADSRRSINGVHDAYSMLFLGHSEPSGTVLWIVFGILLLAFVLHRLFCNLLCPVGNFSKLFLLLLSRISNLFSGRDSKNAGTIRKE